MDDIALSSDLTQADRGDRAREAFKVYGDAYPVAKIEDLITDLLHLADIDEPDGEDAGGVVSAALANYEGERPTWPEGGPEDPS